MYLILLLLISAVLNASHAMAPDGIHKHDDYVELSFDSPEFDAACAVVDSKVGVSMTGVLISPDIVVTAAHGVEAIFRKLKPTQTEHGIMTIPIQSIRVYFRGRNQTIMAEATHVLLDPRYFQEGNTREGKFDFAFLKLSNPLRGITPAELFYKETIPSNALMTVVTYGVSDIKNGVFSWFGSHQPTRRAFRLYERDTYFGKADDEEVLKSSRYLQESSVYFKPLKRNTKPEETDSEEIVRSYEATQNWVADGKKPYALGLPGTSGSPVFIRLTKNGKTKDYLFALVSSYAHLTGQFHKRGAYEMDHILANQKQSLGGYQTIYSLFYRHKTDEPAPKHHATYTQDPILRFLLKAINKESNHLGMNIEKERAQSKGGLLSTLGKLLNIS
ncbi:MAG: hypothetical protein NWS47_00505 [Alphaproteobacteria bacterium]|nr:hypothetical protein [Alphaproteobacteria bacterium]